MATKKKHTANQHQLSSIPSRIEPVIGSNAAIITHTYFPQFMKAWWLFAAIALILAASGLVLFLLIASRMF